MALDFTAEGSPALDFTPSPAAPQKRPFRGTHFSHTKPDGGVLRGALRGSSPESSDAHRVHLGRGAPAGVHAYKAGAIAHPAIKGRQFASGVSGDHAIADIDGTERDTWATAFKTSYQQNIAAGVDPSTAKLLAQNDGEHALLASGYTGMEASKNQPGSVILWGDIPTDSAKSA